MQFTLSAKSAARTGGWKTDGRPIGAGVQEKDFATIRSLTYVYDAISKKYTVKLEGSINNPGTTSISIAYIDNANHKSTNTVNRPVSGGNFDAILDTVEIAQLPPADGGNYKLKDLKISDQSNAALVFDAKNLDLYLGAPTAPVGGGAEGVAAPVPPAPAVPVTLVEVGQIWKLKTDETFRIRITEIAATGEISAVQLDGVSTPVNFPNGDALKNSYKYP